MKNQTKNKECLVFEKHLISALKHGLEIEDYKFFKQHLNTCNACQKKYKIMKKILNDFKTIQKNYSNSILERKNLLSIKEYQNINENISAYIDKETTVEESFYIKKKIITNKFFKENFTKTNSLIILLHKGFEGYKRKFKIREKIRNFLFFTKKHI